MTDLILHVLSGPYAGRQTTARQVAAEGISPRNMFLDLMKRGYEWCLVMAPHGDLSTEVAPGVTAEDWFGEDLGARVVRALETARPIHFDGRTWQVNPANRRAVTDVLRQLVDLLADNDGLAILSDDEHGVVLLRRPG